MFAISSFGENGLIVRHAGALRVHAAATTHNAAGRHSSTVMAIAPRIDHPRNASRGYNRTGMSQQIGLGGVFISTSLVAALSMRFLFDAALVIRGTPCRCAAVIELPALEGMIPQ